MAGDGGENSRTKLQNVLADSTAEVQRFGYLYRVGDKVLQTQNDYKKEVFNGDLGIIQTVDADESEVVIAFDGLR